MLYNVCMDTITINISMPKGLYKQAKGQAKKYHYTSVSELIRDSLRWWMNDNLTRNGFTPEFEEEVLKAAKEPHDHDIEWDGKGSFTEFVLREGQKKYDQNPGQRKLLPKSQGVARRKPGTGSRNRTAHSVV